MFGFARFRINGIRISEGPLYIYYLFIDVELVDDVISSDNNDEVQNEGNNYFINHLNNNIIAVTLMISNVELVNDVISPADNNEIEMDEIQNEGNNYFINHINI